MFIERYKNNPILKPNKDQSWEAEAVFNGCPIKVGGKIFLLYRALSLPHYHALSQARLRVSDIGIAESRDGINFENRHQFIRPEHLWEQFGCEDPRVTKLGNKYYIFYTAISKYPFGAEGIKIGLAISRDLKKIDTKHLVTPFNAKAMALFPKKINGKFWAVLTVNTDQPPAKICLASFDNEEDIWSDVYWNKWYKNFANHALVLERSSNDFIEVGAPPIETEKGWLLFYSYIRNYFSGNRLFGIEAVLLDKKDPSKIISRTGYPLLAPEEYYERFGLIPNVVFPSGALAKKDLVNLYYGAADTTCCLAQLKLSELLKQMSQKEARKISLVRAKQNPIIVPNEKINWEARAVFNPAAIYLNGAVHIFYRAMSSDNTSVIGYAKSVDGIHIDYQSPEPVYFPREPFEQKLQPNGNSGCEDPRMTKIGDKIFLLYTAFDGKNPPRVAISYITEENFLKQNWVWSKPRTISPHDFDDKDAVLFPEKINGQYAIIHRIGDDIDFALMPTLDFQEGDQLEEYRWITPRKGWWDSKKIGAAAPPIKTKAGWIFFYHGVSDDNIYRIGACLLDLKNPTKILSRTYDPIFEPEADYEKQGQINNVVFPCGAVLIKDKIFVYYGGGDKVVGVATILLADLLKVLK